MTQKPEPASIELAITEFIREELLYDQPDLELSPELGLIENGILDSISIFKIIGFLEDRYEVSVKPDEIVIDNFATIAAIRDFAASRV